MSVYVIRGSEDGVISVQGSYKKAYQACVQYVSFRAIISGIPTFEEFKKGLSHYNSSTISYERNKCEAIRMDVE